MSYADLIGTPYREGARGGGFIDCYGLLQEMYLRAGTQIPDYDREGGMGAIALVAGAKNGSMWNWRRVEKRPGVAVVFRDPRGMGGHVGFVIEHDRFIHADEGIGQVLVERLSTHKAKVIGFFDYEVK